MVKLLLLGGLAAAAAGGAYVRTASLDPAVWHADPEAGARTGKPNDVLLAEGGDDPAPRFAAAPEAVMQAFDDVAMADERVERLAGTPSDLHVTYVQRSQLMGYPDVISAKAVAEDGGTRLTVWSRSRFGYSDMGVNRARMDRWLAAIEEAL